MAMSLDDNNDSPWFRDERHREQLAVVVRDDLLGLARYLVNKKRVLLHKEEEEREVRIIASKEFRDMLSSETHL